MYDDATFLYAMNRGKPSADGGVEGSVCCVFRSELNAPVSRPLLAGSDGSLTLEFTYGMPSSISRARLCTVGTNLVIEESANGRLADYIAEMKPKYIGQALMLALRFKIRDLNALTDRCVDEMKELEDDLDDCTDNTGTYRLLDFRRAFAEVGRDIISIKEILALFDKGYYPMQMQNSYVIQGQITLDLRFLDERYDLVKNTIVKDMDTYTSIVNNNINRNTRILSIVAIVGVALNFFFGTLIPVDVRFGIIGGVIVCALAAAAVFYYHRGGLQKKKRGRSGRRTPMSIHADGREAIDVEHTKDTARDAIEEAVSATPDTEEKEEEEVSEEALEELKEETRTEEHKTKDKRVENEEVFLG